MPDIARSPAPPPPDPIEEIYDTCRPNPRKIPGVAAAEGALNGAVATERSWRPALQ